MAPLCRKNRSTASIKQVAGFLMFPLLKTGTYCNNLLCILCILFIPYFFLFLLLFLFIVYFCMYAFFSFFLSMLPFWWIKMYILISAVSEWFKCTAAGFVTVIKYNRLIERLLEEWHIKVVQFLKQSRNGELWPACHWQSSQLVATATACDNGGHFEHQI